MLINIRGRGESDPMRVPAPTHMATSAADSFEAMLQAQQSEQAPRELSAPVAEAPPEEPAVVAEDQAAEDQPVATDRPGTDTDTNTNDALHEDDLPSGETASNPDVVDTLRRGEPERQETAGKGIDSPRPSQHPAESLLIAVVQHGSQPGNGPLGNAGNAAAAVQAITGSKTGEGPTRGIDGSLQRAATPGNAAAITPGYRTSAKTSVELLDHARDSVFKQILMKLNDGGGEMRLRLEPPDLGELDLHMVVEGGNKMTLWIGAERPEVTQLLQRHLDELRHTLRASGLEVTDAQVQTRDDGTAGDRSGHPAHGGHRGNGEQGDDDAQPFQRRGYVTATGLDFWA